MLSGEDHYHSSLFASHANECELQARQYQVLSHLSAPLETLYFISPINLDKGRLGKMWAAKTNRKMGALGKYSAFLDL